MPLARVVRSSALLAALLLLADEGRAAPITVRSANSDAVRGFFATQLPEGGAATISGHAATDYDGEGYLVGPLVDGEVQWRNLTDYNGRAFLINDRFGSNSSQITVELSFPIYSISFDYEIFPNIGMADGRGHDMNSPGWPDFTFKADGAVIFRAFGVLPGKQGTFSQSPNSLKNQSDPFEHSPQLIASSGTILFPDGVKKLEFIDWPPVIGVNNLQFSASPLSAPVPAPEPAMLVLFGLAVAGAGAYAWRRRRQARGA